MQQRETSGILSEIGETPLVDFNRYLEAGGALSTVKLLVKLESFNPGGSAKDRPAQRMIEEALATKVIDQRSTIVESSSGNMGIGLAQVCRYYGLPLICVVDPNAQTQNVAIMKALGAKIELVEEELDGSFLAARWKRVDSLLRDIPGAWWPNQYSNRQNPLAHYHGTIREIDEALDGDFDYLFVATSSTGTAQGCQDYLRSMDRRAKVIAVDALGSSLFGGQSRPRKIPGLGAGVIPPLAKGQSFHDVIRVSDLDCVVGCRRASATEAVLVGGSAGGVLEAVRRRSVELAGKTCVAILHDSGSRYLDTVFSDDWVERELGCTVKQMDAMIESCHRLRNSLTTAESTRNVIPRPTSMTPPDWAARTIPEIEAEYDAELNQ